MLARACLPLPFGKDTRRFLRKVSKAKDSPATTYGGIKQDVPAGELNDSRSISIVQGPQTLHIASTPCGFHSLVAHLNAKRSVSTLNEPKRGQSLANLFLFGRQNGK